HALTFGADRTLWIGNDGGAYRYKPEEAFTAAQGGNTFTDLNDDLVLTQFQPGLAGTVGGTLVGGTQDNGTESTTNGAGAWTRRCCGDGGYAAIDPADPTTIYATYVNGLILKSTDGGANGNNSFPVVSPTYPVGDVPLFYSPLLMDPSDAKTLYAGSSSLW